MISPAIEEKLLVISELIKKCRHTGGNYLGATHQRLSVEGGKVTSAKGVLIGHHHYLCGQCGHGWAIPIWEQPMTVKHVANEAKALVTTP